MLKEAVAILKDMGVFTLIYQPPYNILSRGVGKSRHSRLPPPRRHRLHRLLSTRPGHAHREIPHPASPRAPAPHEAMDSSPPIRSNSSALKFRACIRSRRNAANRSTTSPSTGPRHHPAVTSTPRRSPHPSPNSTTSSIPSNPPLSPRPTSRPSMKSPHPPTKASNRASAASSPHAA